MGHYAGEPGMPAWGDSVDASIAAMDAGKVAKDAVHVDVTDHGALGDGSTNDTAAIQAAINLALSTGVRRVFFPARTFIIGGSGDILTATAGLELYGPGTIKVRDGNGPWNAMFNTTTADASGLHVHGLTWDGNATNNQPTAGDFSGGSYLSTERRVAIRADHGTGIRIADNKFHDFDSEWVFISANDASDVKVLRNGFYKMGNLVDSSLTHDHSTVYVDATGYEIAHNVFSAYEPGVTSGAMSYGAISNMDTHGPGGEMHHNLTIGYLFAGQLSTSPYRTNTGIHWHHNIALNCGTGIQVTPYTYPMTDVRIENNDHQLDYLMWKDHPWHKGGAGLIMYSTNGAECRDVRITDNTFRWVEATLTGQSMIGSGIQSPGIRWGRGEAGGTAWDRNFTITGNTVIGAPNNGIIVQLSNVDTLKVSDNTIIDANSTAETSTTYSVGVFVDAATSVTRADVERNRVLDTQTSTHTPYGNTAATVTAAYSLWYSLGYMRGANGNTASAATGWIKLARETNKTVFEPPPLVISRSYISEHAARTTLTVVADTAYWMPVRLGHGAITQAAVEIVTAAAGSSIEAALYADAAGLPGAKVYSLGTIDSTLTSWRATTAGVWPVQPGIYWVAVVAHGGTPTLRVGTGRSTLIRSATFAGVTTTDLTGVSATGQTSLPATAPAPGAYGQAPVCYVVGA